jgi:antirestriction protein ArdC
MTKVIEQFNFFTGYKYQGVNAQDLASKGFKSNEWGTYKQWFEHEFQVQKGNKGTGIMLVKKDDDTGKTVVRWYKVFNREQVAPVEVPVEA